MFDEGRQGNDDDDEKTLLTLGGRTAAQRPMCVVAAMASLRSLCLSLGLSHRTAAFGMAGRHNRKASGREVRALP
jgi:hypothetical protein